MRKKGPSKKDKNRPAKEKRQRKNSNFSSNKTHFVTDQSNITAGKIPKISTCSSSSIDENNISIINQKTNSSKNKTGISTDISIGNDLIKQNFQDSNSKNISSFNLQKVNTYMDIFIPSEPSCIDAGFSSRKKLKTSIINSPNYSDMKFLENTDSIINNHSMKKFLNNKDNFLNKNLNEVYAKKLGNNIAISNNINKLNPCNTDKGNDKYEEIMKNLDSNNNSFDYPIENASRTNSISKEKILKSSNKDNNVDFIIHDSIKNKNINNLNFSNNISNSQNNYYNNNHSNIKNTYIINNNLLSIKEIKNINNDNGMLINENLSNKNSTNNCIKNYHSSIIIKDDIEMNNSDININDDKFKENQILVNNPQIISNNFYEIEENLVEENISDNRININNFFDKNENGNMNKKDNNNFNIKSSIFIEKDNNEINKIKNNNILMIEEFRDFEENANLNNKKENYIIKSNNSKNDIELLESKLLHNDSNNNFKSSDDYMYFDFNNVNIINNENILIDNKYTNFNYEMLFINNNFSNDFGTNYPNSNDINNISFRITNIINPKRKTQMELEHEINDNKFLYEKDMNTCIRKNCNYMENNQEFIRPKMRKILLDWIQEISSQLNFKRSTYHLSISILDMFLSKYTNLEVDKLQLTGVTCLIIAAKYEEIVIPSIHQMASATENACTYQDIIVHETLILKTLEWNVNVTNFSTWINETTINWDKFIDTVLIHSNEYMLNVELISSIRFRTKNNSLSLFLFKMFAQYIDLISLDIEYLYYSERILCLAVIYLMILKYFNMINLSQIPYLKLEHVNHLFEFNLLFDRFLNQFYSLEFVNIFDHIQYVSCFIEADLHFEQMDLDNIMHWEEILQIQTFNPNNDKNEKDAAKRKNILRHDNNNNL